MHYLDSIKENLYLHFIQIIQRQYAFYAKSLVNMIYTDLQWRQSRCPMLTASFNIGITCMQFNMLFFKK